MIHASPHIATVPDNVSGQGGSALWVSAGRVSKGRVSKRRGLSLIEVIFAAAIAVIGLAMFVPLLAERDATEDLHVTAEIMRAHARTASNLAVSDLPMFGRPNDPGNPLAATTDADGESVVDDINFLPYSLLRAVLTCMDASSKAQSGAHNIREGVREYPSDDAALVLYNEDRVELPDGSGNYHESLLTLVAQGRALDAEPAARNRVLTDAARRNLDRYDSIWRLMSSHCTFFSALDGNNNPDAATLETDELKIAWSTGDVVPSGTGVQYGTFRCVDAAYLDDQGKIWTPGSPNRIDTPAVLVGGGSATSGRVRFVEIDSDTCIGARLLADAAGGIHWKSSLGLDDQGNDARVAFYIGFEDADRAIEAAIQLGNGGQVADTFANISVDSAYKLKVYVVPLRYSAQAHAAPLARKIGPSALIASRGDYHSSSPSPRPSAPIAFRNPFSQTPIRNTFIPWPLKDPTASSPELLIRENAVVIDSANFESRTANAWLASFVGERRSSEASGIPANAITLGHSVYHTTNQSGNAVAARTLRNEDNRYDISGFSTHLAGHGKRLMDGDTAGLGTANLPPRNNPARKPPNVDATALPLSAGLLIGTDMTNATDLHVGTTGGNLWRKFGVQTAAEGPNNVSRLWPRLLDVGSEHEPVRRLTIRDDAVFSQLRVEPGAQVRVLGRIAVGVSCEELAGASKGLGAALTQKQIGQLEGETAASRNPALANPSPVLSSTANRYSPLCHDGRNTTTTPSATVADAAPQAAEVSANLPYRGFYMQPHNRDIDLGTHFSVYTRQIQVEDGAALALSVRKPNPFGTGDVTGVTDTTDHNIFRYKECLLDDEGDSPGIPGTPTNTWAKDPDTITIGGLEYDGTKVGNFQIARDAPEPVANRDPFIHSSRTLTRPSTGALNPPGVISGVKEQNVCPN